MTLPPVPVTRRTRFLTYTGPSHPLFRPLREYNGPLLLVLELLSLFLNRRILPLLTRDIEPRPSFGPLLGSFPKPLHLVTTHFGTPVTPTIRVWGLLSPTDPSWLPHRVDGGQGRTPSPLTTSQCTSTSGKGQTGYVGTEPPRTRPGTPQVEVQFWDAHENVRVGVRHCSEVVLGGPPSTGDEHLEPRVIHVT